MRKTLNMRVTMPRQFLPSIDKNFNHKREMLPRDCIFNFQTIFRKELTWCLQKSYSSQQQASANGQEDCPIRPPGQPHLEKEASDKLSRPV